MHFVLLSWCAVSFGVAHECLCVLKHTGFTSSLRTHNALSSVWCPLCTHKMTVVVCGVFVIFFRRVLKTTAPLSVSFGVTVEKRIHYHSDACHIFELYFFPFHTIKYRHICTCCFVHISCDLLCGKLRGQFPLVTRQKHTRTFRLTYDENRTDFHSKSFDDILSFCFRFG